MRMPHFSLSSTGRFQLIRTLDADRHHMDPLVSRLESALAHECGRDSSGIASAWLFGSRARGTARATSDLDVAVLFSEDPPRTLEGLHLDLADRLTGEVGRPVDLIVLNRAPLASPSGLARRHPAPGARSARIRVDVRARNQYFDLLPHLLRYRRGRHLPANPFNEDKRS